MKDNRPLGIALMLLAAFFMCVADAAGKWAMTGANVVQLNTVRGLISILILAPIALREGGWVSLRTRRPIPHLLRAILLVSLAFTWFYALSQMPLADAAGIGLCAPLFMMALSVAFLRDRADSLRWAAVFVGFAGMLLIIKPGTDVFHPISFLPAWAAVGYAVYMVSNRALRETESVTALTLYPQLGVFLVAGALLPWFWGPVTWDIAVAMVLTGLAAGAGHLLLTYAFRLAPPSVIAPLDYTALAWEVAFGFFLFSDWPDNLTWVGLVLIVSAGLFIIYREALASRTAPAGAH